MTYGNRNPKHRPHVSVSGAPDRVERLLETEQGRKAIREALDEEAVAEVFARFRGRLRTFPTDEYYAKAILDAAVLGE